MKWPWNRLLVVAPHPDDESLAIGGFLARAARSGATVSVVYLTDGEWNHWPQRFVEKRWRIGDEDRRRWGSRRREEARAALSMLSIAPDAARFLGLPDNRLQSLDRSGTLTTVVRRIIEETRPDLIVAPSRADLHVDHRAVARVLDAMPELTEDGSAIDQLRYLTHGSCSSLRPALVLQLNRDELEAKQRAIECHPSQLALSRRRLMRFAGTHEALFAASERSEPRFAPLQRIVQLIAPAAPPVAADRLVTPLHDDPAWMGNLKS